MEALIILKGSRVGQIDAKCVEGGIDSKQLMGNAGSRVAETIIKDFKESFQPNGRTGRKVKGVVVCGGGNNGGDGFAAAAILAGTDAGIGVEIDVFCITGTEKFSVDSKYYFDALSINGNVKIHFLNPEDLTTGRDFISKLEMADFIVDAIFGTGLHGREIHGQAKAVIACINSAKNVKAGFGNAAPMRFPGEVSGITAPGQPPDTSGEISAVAALSEPEDISSPGRPGGPGGPIILDEENRSNAIIYSIDIPSGIDSDTAQVLGTAVKADKTITFGCKKLGIALYPGKDFAGEVIIADIGIPLKYCPF